MLGVLALLAAAGCGGSLGPGDALVGDWGSPDAVLNASGQRVLFNEPCLRAVFPPIRLDASRGFSAISDTLTITGNVIHFPDDRLQIVQGFLAVGDTLHLTLVVQRSEPPVSDPIEVILPPGQHALPLVCTA